MRGWREPDLAPWAAMNADPEVRRYLGPLLTFEQAEAWALNFQDDLDRYGFGFWALEVRASGDFIGFTGLGTVDEDMPFAGTELAWRLARSAWGHGYAAEAALAEIEPNVSHLACPGKERRDLHFRQAAASASGPDEQPGGPGAGSAWAARMVGRDGAAERAAGRTEQRADDHHEHGHHGEVCGQ